MQRKIVFLINPISGTSTKKGIAQLIRDRCRETQIEFEIVSTEPDGNYRALKERIIFESITDLVICGGDGSVNAVAASMLGVDLNIGVIPMGSGNGFARTAGISSKPQLAMETIVSGNTMLVDGFTINGQFSCMLCGIGFDAQVAHEFAKRPGRGLKTYVQVSAENFFSAKPKAFRIIVDEQIVDVDAFFISVANSNQFGNNFTIAPKARLNDGLLDIVIVKGMNKFMLPFSILRQVTGINPIQMLEDLTSEKNVIYFQTDKLKIENPALALLHIDGDPKDTAETFDIQVIPNALRLLVP